MFNFHICDLHQKIYRNIHGNNQVHLKQLFFLFIGKKVHFVNLFYFES